MRELHEGVMASIRDELNQVLMQFRNETNEMIESKIGDTDRLGSGRSTPLMDAVIG